MVTMTEKTNGFFQEIRCPADETGEDSLEITEISNRHVNEATPFKDPQSNINDNKNKASLYTKIVSDKEYREKAITSLGLILSFSMLGWSIGQIGPSLLDLQIITDASLKDASAFQTSYLAGYLVGSLVFGVLYDHVSFERVLLVCLTVLGHAVGLAVIPWCKLYELMITAHVLTGIFGGGLDTTNNAHILSVWGKDGKSIMQAMHFAYALGGIVSPFATASFLAPQEARLQHVSSNDTTEEFTEHSLSNLTASGNHNQTVSGFTGKPTSPFIDSFIEEPVSRLYIAFFISAGLTFLTSFPLFFSYITAKQKAKNNKCKTTEHKIIEGKNKPTEIPRVLKLSTLVCLMLLCSLYCVVFYAFNGYLTTFCVKHMKWTKFQGAAVTSVFWACFAVGRFLGIFLIMFIRPVRIILFLCLLLALSYLGFLITSLFLVDVGIWICTSLVGLALSVLFPSVLTWTEGEIFSVTGSVTSLFLISGSAGAMINPIILGSLMDKESPIVFSYLLFGESVFFLFIFLLTFYLSRKIKCLKYKSRESDYEIELKGDDHDRETVENKIDIGD